MPTEPPSLDDPAPAVSARLEDVCSIDAIINALYEAVSFAEGGAPDERRLRGLVSGDVRLLKVLSDGRCMVGDIDSYLGGVQARIAEGALRAFDERELFRRTEVYSGIAHVFTTYEATFGGSDGDRSVRGINSVQLRNDGGRWWVLSIFWTDEEEGSPIPAAYLPRS